MEHELVSGTGRTCILHDGRGLTESVTVDRSREDVAVDTDVVAVEIGTVRARDIGYGTDDWNHRAANGRQVQVFGIHLVMWTEFATHNVAVCIEIHDVSDARWSATVTHAREQVFADCPDRQGAADQKQVRDISRYWH